MSRYWQIYQTYAHPFYPALIDPEHFGTLLFSFLDHRLSGGVLPEGTSPSWLGLLFSVMACGAQFSTDPIKERDLRSKVFGMVAPTGVSHHHQPNLIFFAARFGCR
jgi:hypothetical protein